MRPLLILLMIPAFAQAQLPPIKLTVDAAAEARPALRYELLPNARDRVLCVKLVVTAEAAGLLLLLRERLPRFVGAVEIGLQREGALEGRSPLHLVAVLELRQSEVVVVDRVVWRFRNRAFERCDRMLRETFAIVDPAQRVL